MTRSYQPLRKARTHMPGSLGGQRWDVIKRRATRLLRLRMVVDIGALMRECWGYSGSLKKALSQFDYRSAKWPRAVGIMIAIWRW
jgi:hypothetical protein